MTEYFYILTIVLTLIIFGAALIIWGIVLLYMDSHLGKRFDTVITGTVVGYVNDIPDRKSRQGVFTRAVVEYEVNGQKRWAAHRFSQYVLHKLPRSEKGNERFEIDDNNCLHYYRSPEFGGKSDIAGKLFPIGTEMEVHYRSKGPWRTYLITFGRRRTDSPWMSYCGAPTVKYRKDAVVFLACGIVFIALGVIVVIFAM